MSDTEFTLDFSEYDLTNLPTNNKKSPKPGKATLIFTSCTPKMGQDGSPYLAVTFDVAAHEDPSQVNMEFYQSMSPVGEKSAKVVQLAEALGLITAEDRAEKSLNPAKEMKMDLTSAYGNLVCGEITQKGTYKPKIWDFYSLTDPASAGFPKPDGAAPAPPEAPAEPPPAAVPPAAPAAETNDDDDIPF